MSKDRITKVIIPVAGYGTRFLPVTKAMPKEMLPVVDTPIIQYLVHEAVASGITDVIFVTGRGKRSIEDHFDTSYELEQTLVERDRKELIALVRPLATMARFVYVRQPMPLGNGDAIARALHLVGNDEPVAVMFGDDIIDSPRPALGELMKAFLHYGDPVVALSRVSWAELSHYGAVKGRALGKKRWEVSTMIEKPDRRTGIPVPLAVAGRYILTPDLSKIIMAMQQKHLQQKELTLQEFGITDAIVRYVKHRPIYGVELEGMWYDCGSKIGYLKANIAYALKRPDLSSPLRSFLRKIRP